VTSEFYMQHLNSLFDYKRHIRFKYWVKIRFYQWVPTSVKLF